MYFKKETDLKITSGNVLQHQARRKDEFFHFRWTAINSLLEYQRAQRAINDETTFGTIKQESTGSTIEKEINENIQVFAVSGNSKSLSRIYRIQFYCEYSMAWYPFNFQPCHIQMII